MKTLPSSTFSIGGGGGGLEEGLWRTFGGPLSPPLVCSGIAKNAKNACAKSLGTVHGVYNEGEPSVGLFV